MVIAAPCPGDSTLHGKMFSLFIIATDRILDIGMQKILVCLRQRIIDKKRRIFLSLYLFPAITIKSPFHIKFLHCSVIIFAQDLIALQKKLVRRNHADLTHKRNQLTIIFRMF